MPSLSIARPQKLQRAADIFCMLSMSTRDVWALLRSKAAAFGTNCDGDALVEYAIVLASLSVLMIGVLGLISSGTGRNLNKTQTGMTAWSQTQ